MTLLFFPNLILSSNSNATAMKITRSIQIGHMQSVIAVRVNANTPTLKEEIIDSRKNLYI